MRSLSAVHRIILHFSLLQLSDPRSLLNLMVLMMLLENELFLGLDLFHALSLWLFLDLMLLVKHLLMTE